MLLDQEVASVPYSPLARGLLARAGTGRECAGHRYETDDSAVRVYGVPDEEVLGRVAGVARDRGVSPAQVALAWLLHQPAVTAPIIGVTKPKHLEDAIRAIDIELTDDEIERLNV